MPALARFAPAAVLAGLLLLGPPAHARGGAVVGFAGFRAAHSFAGWPGRIVGLHPRPARPALPALALRHGIGARRGIAVHPGLAAHREAAHARAAFAFERRLALRRVGLPAARWALSWRRGWRARGWWVAGWVFPWDWADYPGSCYQWVYPPSGAPYCAWANSGEL